MRSCPATGALLGGHNDDLIGEWARRGDGLETKDGIFRDELRGEPRQVAADPDPPPHARRGEHRIDRH